MKKPKRKFPNLGRSLDAAKAAEIALDHQSSRLRKALAETASAEDQVEAVHHLRVSARRLSASLKAFSDRLPTKLQKKLRKRARTLRRAAGEVRDIDILIKLVDKNSHGAPEEEKDLLRPFRQHLKEKRERCFSELCAALDEEQGSDFWKKLDKRLSRIERSGEKVADVAPRLLRARVDKLAKAWEPALNGDDEKLHSLRIAFKDLRYTLDLFRGYYGNRFPEPLYRDLEQSQERLGDIHDERVLIDELLKFAEKENKAEPAKRVTARLSHRLDARKRDWFRFVKEELGKSQRGLARAAAVSN